MNVKKIWPVPVQKFMPYEAIVEKRSVALVTSKPAWEAVKCKLSLPIVWQTDVKFATTDYWDSLMENFKGEVIYAVGGGLPTDAAKYIAFKKGIEVVCLPTALSVDAFTAWSSGIRIDGCVEYIPTKIVDELVIDFDVIAKAPSFIRAAAICDVLSIATGCWDWKFAEEKGRNTTETKFIPYIYQMAKSILEGAIDCAEAAGKGDHDGLKQLLDCVILETQILNQVGHARPEEGSEHYFAYLVENLVGPGKPHANLVCPGILIIATIQGQNIASLKRSMKYCNIPLNTISNDVIEETLKKLPKYSSDHGLLYGIAHELKKEDWEKLSFKKILG
jgi:glycerol-1-phosphate dehydrogenase [NAD(P)+]